MSKELDELIENFSGLVAVELVEPFYEVREEMEALENLLERELSESSRFVRIFLSEHKEWAKKFKVFGSPAVLIFQNGSLALRIQGTCSVDEIKSIFKQKDFFF